MQIKNLEHTSLADIVTCLLQAFKDYFVKMPESPDYWEQRFKGARLELSLSFGVFDQDKLVAFILNGIDQRDGYLTAFNTGTGVLESYRGQKLVDQIYHFALPKLKQSGVGKCVLEVIQANHRAIRVYERIGFSICRNYPCFKGKIPDLPLEVIVKPIDLTSYQQRENPNLAFYSWDHGMEAVNILSDSYQAYLVMNQLEQIVGQFLINPTNGNLAQLEASSTHLPQLFAAVRQVCPEIKINNVDDRRADLIQYLNQIGIANPIDQYEMEMVI